MNNPNEQFVAANYIEERQADGVARVNRSIFTDPDLFELEMEKIWEGNWIYLAHESQIPNPNDFMTLFMGRTPIILVRDPEGNVNAFVNACGHRGTTLLREECGNKADYSCPFHGWVFDTRGDATVVFKEDVGDYPEQFDKKDYGLTKVAKVESYRGFIFGSLNGDVVELAEHLGPASTFIDLLVDQSLDGIEVLKGRSSYIFQGNWKIQAENGVDGYHVYATHGNYVATTERRRKLRGEEDVVKPIQVGDMINQRGMGGTFELGHGHCVVYGNLPNPGDRPGYGLYEEHKQKYGEVRTHWMLGRMRNMLLYPNVFVMDQTSTQIRVFRPIDVDTTEVTIYGIAPKGESDADRSRRIRQYEDFYNASGMATPDDITEFKQSQIAFKAKNDRWSDVSRGLKNRIIGETHPDAAELDIEVPGGGIMFEDEGVMFGQHRWWA
ncbi:MAG: benzoate 1,2-dioxygenase large subunit, partial [Gammaproteobacteria bacterium]